MDSVALSAGLIGAKPIISGQELKPNIRYFADYFCGDFSLPPRAKLKKGDAFEIWRTIEPKPINMNIPEGLFFDEIDAFENVYVWNSFEDGVPRQKLKLFFNGLDFHLENFGAESSSKAARTGSLICTSSRTFTPNIGVKQLKITAVGAGGGGASGGMVKVAGRPYMYTQGGSGGGGGGGVVDYVIPIEPQMSLSILIGAQGNGGEAVGGGYGKDGSNGGDTKIGDLLICGGGKGGLGGVSYSGTTITTAPPREGGDGGTVTAIPEYISGEIYSGGKGGESGQASSDRNLSTIGGYGGDVNGFLGGAPSYLDAQNGSGGGGGASPLHNGSDGIAFNASSGGNGSGGGGARGQCYNYYDSQNAASKNTGGVSGYRGYALIEWERS